MRKEREKGRHGKSKKITGNTDECKGRKEEAEEEEEEEESHMSCTERNKHKGVLSPFLCLCLFLTHTHTHTLTQAVISVL